MEGVRVKSRCCYFASFVVFSGLALLYPFGFNMWFNGCFIRHLMGFFCYVIFIFFFGLLLLYFIYLLF